MTCRLGAIVLLCCAWCVQAQADMPPADGGADLRQRPPMDDGPIPTPDTDHKLDKTIFCNERYAPVCGKTEHGAKTYSNACFAHADGAKIIGPGPCILGAPRK